MKYETWLRRTYGGALSEWERKRCDFALATTLLIVHSEFDNTFPLFVDAEATPDRFGCRDAIDAAIMGSGVGMRTRYLHALWTLDRLGLARDGEDKLWRLTAQGTDACWRIKQLLALNAVARFLQRGFQQRARLVVVTGGRTEG